MKTCYRYKAICLIASIFFGFVSVLMLGFDLLVFASFTWSTLVSTERNMSRKSDKAARTKRFRDKIFAASRIIEIDNSLTDEVGGYYAKLERKRKEEGAREGGRSTNEQEWIERIYL